MRARQTLFVAAMVTIVAYETWSVFFRPVGVPSNPAGSRPLTIADIAGPRLVSQTFKLGVDGFDSLTVAARPWADATDGTITFRLWQQPEIPWWNYRPPEPRTLLFELRRPAQEVVAAPQYTLRFSPLSSRGTTYTLDIEAPATRVGTGIALLASRDPYRDGQLTVDGRRQWGDLAFSTTATKSTLYRYWIGEARSVLEMGRRIAPLLAGLVLLDIAIAAIVWWVILGGQQGGAGGGERWGEQALRAPVTDASEVSS